MEFDIDIDIEKIVLNREEFNAFVYTPIHEAIDQLNLRRKDKKLEELIDELLTCPVPHPIKHEPKAVLFRQIFTPNYEFLRFRGVIDVLDMDPVFWEYHNDKFTPNNPMKLYLGKMPIHKGFSKKGHGKIEFETIVDFNKSNGRRLADIKTMWNESLIDFHHKLLFTFAANTEKYFFDASEWFKSHNGSAKEYYKNYIALFVRHGILFENFVLEGEELDFTRNVFLPAFIEVYKKTGKKPLIVALSPTDIEGDIFWSSYPQHVNQHIANKRKGTWYTKFFNYFKSLI
ncbi:MAG: hypothetical protein V4690_00910 [Patescibacteria group bacterium]